jgi:hypothetical protein
MSISVVEFVPAKSRTRVPVGEAFQVRLETEWIPASEGGAARVEFSCNPGDYSVTPSSIQVTIPPEGDSVVTRLPIAVNGPGGDLVDVVATGEGGSCDSFTITVTKRGGA